MHAGHMPLPGVSERAVDLGELPCLTQVPYRIASSERATHAHNPTRDQHETRHYPRRYPHPTSSAPACAAARYPPVLRSTHPPSHPTRHPRATRASTHKHTPYTHTLASPGGGYAARLATLLRCAPTRTHYHAHPSPSVLPFSPQRNAASFGETSVTDGFTGGAAAPLRPRPRRLRRARRPRRLRRQHRLRLRRRLPKMEQLPKLFPR